MTEYKTLQGAAEAELRTSLDKLFAEIDEVTPHISGIIHDLHYFVGQVKACISVIDALPSPDASAGGEWRVEGMAPIGLAQVTYNGWTLLIDGGLDEAVDFCRMANKRLNARAAAPADSDSPYPRSVMLKVQGKRYVCDQCGANVQTQVSEHLYTCNGCGDELTDLNENEAPRLHRAAPAQAGAPSEFTLDQWAMRALKAESDLAELRTAQAGLREALEDVARMSCEPHRHPGYEVCAHGYRPDHCPIQRLRAALAHEQEPDPHAHWTVYLVPEGADPNCEHKWAPIKRTKDACSKCKAQRKFIEQEAATGTDLLYRVKKYLRDRAALGDEQAKGKGCTCVEANDPECPLHGYGEDAALAPQEGAQGQ